MFSIHTWLHESVTQAQHPRLALRPALGLPRLSGRSCQLLCRGGYSLRACVLPWLASRLHHRPAAVRCFALGAVVLHAVEG